MILLPPLRGLREWSALVGQSLTLTLGFDVDELLELPPELHAFDSVVRNSEPNERIGKSHHTEADASDSLRQRVDFREREIDALSKRIRRIGFCPRNETIHWFCLLCMRGTRGGQRGDVVECHNGRQFLR